MATRNTPDVTTGTPRCVAGLFHDDGQAADAMRRLHQAGFSAAEIGIATSGTPDTHSHIWQEANSMLGKQDHVTEAHDVEESLESCGLSADEARYFNHSLAGGDVLLTVHASAAEKARAAREILQGAGADLGAATATASRAPAAPLENRRIQLLGEVLRVHKDRIQRGEVRLRKEAVTEQQHIEVPVTREELVIERSPVQQGETTAQVGSGEKEIRVPLTEEQVRVEKKPVIREEVRVGKKEVQDVQDVSETVRHEELRTEKKGDVEPRPNKGKRVA